MINKVVILERMILDLEPEQREELLAFLEAIHEIDKTRERMFACVNTQSNDIVMKRRSMNF